MFTLAAWSTKWLWQDRAASAGRGGSTSTKKTKKSKVEPDLYLCNGNGIRTMDVPTPVPASLRARLSGYQNARSATFEGWFGDGGMLISTKFGNTPQTHLVAAPGGRRTQLTFFETPVTDPTPIPGSDDSFFFMRDQGGSEKWQIFKYDTSNFSQQLMTDGKSKNQALKVSHDGAAFAYSSSLRNNKDWDVYVQCCDGSGKRMVLQASEGSWATLDWSHDRTKLLVRQYISATRQGLFVVDLSSSGVPPPVPLECGQGDEDIAVGSALWAAGGGLFYTSSKDTEFLTLRHANCSASGGVTRVTHITEDIPWDIIEMTLAPNGMALAFLANEGGSGRIYLLSTRDCTFAAIDTEILPRGVVSGLSFSPSGDEVGFGLDSTVSPGNAYSVRVSTGVTDDSPGSRGNGSLTAAVQQWTHSEAPVDTAEFVEPELLEYASFDGKQIPAFFYMPSKITGPLKPEDAPPTQLPVVIYIHGGPASQFKPTFQPTNHPQSLQYLVSTGIAVVAPNVRGSRGYGKTYLAADDAMKRHESVEDIGALLGWIAAHKDLDERRVCVMGRSYGGFMTLSALARYSDRIACGVATCGMSHLVTFLESTAEWRRDLRRPEYGDERDPEVRQYLHQTAPLTNASTMNAPLLICQGANDSRVPLSESLQIADAVRCNGQPCWVMVADGEGHVFKKKTTMDTNSEIIAMFLTKFL